MCLARLLWQRKDGHSTTLDCKMMKSNKNSKWYQSKYSHPQRPPHQLPRSMVGEVSNTILLSIKLFCQVLVHFHSLRGYYFWALTCHRRSWLRRSTIFSYAFAIACGGTLFDLLGTLSSHITSECGADIGHTSCISCASYLGCLSIVFKRGIEALILISALQNMWWNNAYKMPQRSAGSITGFVY